jgi:hypothetical protein
VQVGQTWAMAQVIANTLFSSVKQCVSSKLRVWLLLDAFIFIFTLCIIMKFGVANVEALNQQLICNEFYSKLQEHKQRMMVQVVGILIPVLAF